MIADMGGRVVAVIGAGGGIGEASVQQMAAAGATVACLNIHGDVAEAVAARTRSVGGKATASQIDVRSRDSIVGALSSVVSEQGRLDAVVDVVGHSRVQSSAAVSDADWVELIEINLRHQFVVAQVTATTMVELRTPGSFVAIGSICGSGSAPKQAVYGIAKAGVASLVRSFAIEYAHAGIRFNAIAAGVVLTPRQQAAGRNEGEGGRRVRAAIPLGRLAAPDEIGSVVLFLASDMSSYMTGQVIGVDGGASVAPPLPLPRPGTAGR